MDSARSSTIRKPFIEHLHELRTRLVWCALAMSAGSGLGFALHENLLALIQRPLGQTLYFTSPTGGFNFVFKMSLTFGLVVAMPVLVYQFMKFLSPLIGTHKFRILSYLIWSLMLAYAGVLFAYIISLPAALRFLTSFGGANIQALITADEYFNFALAYIGGFALLFQIPLIMLFINRIKPLRPSKLMGVQRFIILGSFIVAAILTPTPDPFNQMIMALPIILLYQIGIILIWAVNRKRPAAEEAVVLSEQAIKEISREVTVPLEPRTPLTHKRPRPAPGVRFADILPPTRLGAANISRAATEAVEEVVESVEQAPGLGDVAVN
jgi:sec-independent protein translocase protein TatC